MLIIRITRAPNVIMLPKLGGIRKEQMTKESVSINEWKFKVLRNLDTRNLIERLHQYESEMEQALSEQATFKEANREYLTSGVSSDGQEVKRILAELAAQAPASADGKRLSVADRESWLHRQRVENEELSAAIKRQQSVAFELVNHEIRIEMARRRLEGTKSVDNSMASLLNFLVGE